MSEESAVNTSCCASCGIAEIDEIKLMECDDCDLVRYCGDECQRNHKSEHEETCKKRATELRDELLFKQPESSHMGDCPICSLPLPLDLNKSILTGCCCKMICDGCYYANQTREFNARLQRTCPFCRKAVPKTAEEYDKLRMIRVKASDPVAICQQGWEQYKKGEYIRSFEYWSRAAALGDTEAHHCLAMLYNEGLGVEKDELKYIYHAEEAAIGGHPRARYILGCVERNCNDNVERAMKHFFISAKQGDDLSIKALMKAFKQGFIEKDDLAAALRAHKVAVDATKSAQRKKTDDAKKLMNLKRGMS